MISNRLAILLLLLIMHIPAYCSIASGEPMVDEEIEISLNSLEARIAAFEAAVSETSTTQPEDYKNIFRDLCDFLPHAADESSETITLLFRFCNALLNSDFADPIRFASIIESFHRFFPDGWQRDDDQAKKALKIIDKAISAGRSSKDTTYEAQLKGLKTRFSSNSPAHASPSKKGSRTGSSTTISTPLLRRSSSQANGKEETGTASSTADPLTDQSKSKSANATRDTNKAPKHLNGAKLPEAAVTSRRDSDSSKIDPNKGLEASPKPKDASSLRSTGTGESHPKKPVSPPKSPRRPGEKKETVVTPEPSQEPAKISTGKKAFVVIAALGIAALIGLELFSLAKSKTVV